ncbi:MAG: PAS domain S-box protein [Chloroflexota bacterium]
MKKTNPPTLNTVELRYRAEQKLNELRDKVGNDLGSEVDAQRLLHELEVHQIELEMQNEQMVEQQKELEASLTMYADLYAFAPVAYFVLAQDGLIHKANFTGARLLGETLSDLIKRRIGMFIAPQSLTIFNAFLAQVFASTHNETCEIAFQLDGTAPLWARIEAVLNDDHETCRVVAVEITERKQTEDALRTNEELYRSIFMNMPNGSAYCEMHFDMNDRPSDFTYLVVNRAFETLTGLHNIAGRKATEISPEIRETEPLLMDMYGRVARTGLPEHLEIFMAAMQKRFRVAAHSPKRGCFVTEFDELTASPSG